MKRSKTMRRIGWICFIVMWIPFAALFVGMIGMPEGSYDWADLPALTRYSMLVGGVLFVATMVLLVGAPIVAGLENRAILKRGQPAEATILKIWDTGTTINNNPVVRMLLEVRPPYEPSFQAEAERLISRLQIPMIQPGTVVQVKYDPESRSVALVDQDDQQAVSSDSL